MQIKLFKHNRILIKIKYACFWNACCRLVDPTVESLEAGLIRELQEEMGAAVPVTVDDYVSSHHPHFPSHLILHFYTKKITEAELLEIERAAVSKAVDHGFEVNPQAFT